MTTIRLAHLSDPHLPVAPPSGRECLGKRGLSGLSWRLRRHREHRWEVIDTLADDLRRAAPDVIAVTGDLVNFGLDREFANARDWLGSLGPPERVIAIPGNHDAMSRGWKPKFEARLGAYARLRPVIERHGHLALIPVSTACVTPPFFASGCVGTETTRQMQAALTEAHERALCPIVLMHHPPTGLTAARKALHDRGTVAQAIGRARAALVLHGHTHNRDLSVIRSAKTEVPVLGVPSFSMAPGRRHPPGQWRMITVSGAPGEWSAEFVEHVVQGDGSVKQSAPFGLRLAS